MNTEQRRLLADKLLDLANLMVVGLVAGQLLSADKYSDVLVVGVVGYVLLALVGLFLAGGREDHE